MGQIHPLTDMPYAQELFTYDVETGIYSDTEKDPDVGNMTVELAFKDDLCIFLRVTVDIAEENGLQLTYTFSNYDTTVVETPAADEFETVPGGDDESDSTLPDDETDSTSDKKDDGCASVIGFGAVAMMAICGAGFVFKRKDD